MRCRFEKVKESLTEHCILYIIIYIVWLLVSCRHGKGGDS